MDVRAPRFAGWMQPCPGLFFAPQSLTEATVAALWQALNVEKTTSTSRDFRAGELRCTCVLKFTLKHGDGRAPLGKYK